MLIDIQVKTDDKIGFESALLIYFDFYMDVDVRLYYICFSLCITLARYKRPDFKNVT